MCITLYVIMIHFILCYEQNVMMHATHMSLRYVHITEKKFVLHFSNKVSDT